MVSIIVDVIQIDYTLNYPFISLDVKFVVPDQIPFYGGKSYYIGGGTLSLDSIQVDIPIDLGVVSGDLTFSLDPSRCTFSVGGYVKLAGIWTWQIGSDIPYMTPFHLTEPSWSSNPVKLDPGKFQAKIDAVPNDHTGLSAGARSLRNDAETQRQIRSLFEFCGAGAVLDQMIAAPNHLKAARIEQRDQFRDTKSGRPAEFDSNMLVAFGANLQGGVLGGLTGAWGLYFTTKDGDWGTFGSVAIDVGLIVELSGGLAGFCYCAEDGKTAEENFSGFNAFAAIDGGEIVSVGVTLYWPEDNKANPVYPSPCGIGFALGLGMGFPLNFFIGNSYTILSAEPPPQMRGVQILQSRDSAYQPSCG